MSFMCNVKPHSRTYYRILHSHFTSNSSSFTSRIISPAYSRSNSSGYTVCNGVCLEFPTTTGWFISDFYFSSVVTLVFYNSVCFIPHCFHVKLFFRWHVRFRHSTICVAQSHFWLGCKLIVNLLILLLFTNFFLRILKCFKISF